MITQGSDTSQMNVWVTAPVKATTIYQGDVWRWEKFGVCIKHNVNTEIGDLEIA